MTSASDVVHVVVPPCPELDSFAELIDHERAGMEAEFGLPVRVTRSDPGTGRRWVFRLDPEHAGPAVLRASGDVLALGLRDRFVPAGTLMGSVRHSIGRRLSDPVPLLSSPAAAARWQGRVIVLTDPQTASASEDFLLGLAGLAHVLVIGEPSAGSAGRPRFLEVLPGWGLMISTALTYDRDGRCIEGAGIPVDVEVQVYPYNEEADRQDRVLATAQELA
ncbi:MAG: S41 family peptidase [Streptosporangiaceae bacterium]